MQLFKKIIFLSILFAAKAAQICSIHEIYKECELCPATCDNIIGAKVCPDTECAEGCFCKEGMARNNTGHCVDMFRCLDFIELCGDNEVYLECGSMCPRTCENYGQSSCSKGCKPGCACKEGFVRNSAGKCVDVSECGTFGVGKPDSECGENQVETECGTMCPETCDDRGTQNNCPLECRPGCICAPGYILKNNITSKCINISECPHKHYNEHHHEHHHKHHHKHHHGHHNGHHHEHKHNHLQDHPAPMNQNSHSNNNRNSHSRGVVENRNELSHGEKGSSSRSQDRHGRTEEPPTKTSHA